MSQPKSETEIQESFTETEIADYLRGHLEFFERHQALLLRLKLPHQAGESTVSLVERQVSMLRQRNVELDRQLKDLVDVAKANSELVDNIHKLAIKLIVAESLDAKFEQLESSLREDFVAERAVLVLFADSDRAAGSRPGFVRFIDRGDDSMKPFSTFLRSAHSRCGPLRDRQKAVLFERDADSIVSAAMIPIGQRARLGFLVIGSKDADQFHPGQRVDFLGRLGELIGVALESEYDRDSRR